MITRSSSILANGLRLVTVEMPHLHAIELAIHIKVGGRDDPPHLAGISHFLEHMLFKGSAEFPTTFDLEVAFEAIGGAINASTDAETTCYYTRLHPDYLNRGVELLASMVMRPNLPEIETERRIIIEEALEEMNEKGVEINPDNLAAGLLWPGHPLGQPTVGTLATIAAIGIEDLREHLAKFYGPNNAVLVAAGPVSASALRDAASHVFESWHPVALSPLDGMKEEQQAPQACLVRNSASQVDLQLAFRGFPRSSPQIMHLRLMRRILAGGGSSRLFLTLRERLGLIYAVDAAISAYEESGLFAIDLTCSPDNLEAVVETTLGELLTLARDVMAKEELDRYCQGYNFDLEYSSDSPYEMQVRFGWGELVGFVRDIDEDRQSAGALTPAEIRETAAILFAPQRLNLVAVGPLTVKARRKVERLVAGYEKLWQKEFSSTP